MEKSNNVPATERTARASSPALSSFSELSVFSRSPSPVPGYAAFLPQSNTTAAKAIDCSKLSGAKPRFISREKKRAHSPAAERSHKKLRHSNTAPALSPRARRRHKGADTNLPTPEPTSPTPWVVGDGGFGTLNVLPKEIRQEIYCFAFHISHPVTVKGCCGPDTTRRERDSCREHGIGTGLGTGRFNILQVSKAIREEASWVIFNRGSLLLEVKKAIAPYLDGCRSTTLRHIPGFIQHDKRRTAMWTMAAQFRFVEVRVPESILECGHPTVFTDHLSSIAALLCKTWERQSSTNASAPSISKAVNVSLGTLFHQMLPFNMESQAADRYGELLDWLSVNSPCAEPDFEKIEAESEHNLQRMLSVVGKLRGRSQWKFGVKTQLEEKDKGGARALHAFQIGCAKNGVVCVCL